MKKIKLKDGLAFYDMNEVSPMPEIEVSPTHEVECSCGKRTKFYIKSGYIYDRIESEYLKKYIVNLKEYINKRRFFIEKLLMELENNNIIYSDQKDEISKFIDRRELKWKPKH